MAPVRLEPAALRARVKHSTTEPLRFVSELDFKKELQLEQERQRIQRELSQLDDEENVRGGRENFIIEKKIMAAKVGTRKAGIILSQNITKENVPFSHRGKKSHSSTCFFRETHFHSVTTQTQAVVTIYYHCIIFLFPFISYSMCNG